MERSGIPVQRCSSCNPPSLVAHWPQDIPAIWNYWGHAWAHRANLHRHKRTHKVKGTLQMYFTNDSWSCSSNLWDSNPHPTPAILPVLSLCDLWRLSIVFSVHPFHHEMFKIYLAHVHVLCYAPKPVPLSISSVNSFEATKCKRSLLSVISPTTVFSVFFFIVPVIL